MDIGAEIESQHMEVVMNRRTFLKSTLVAAGTVMAGRLIGDDLVVFAAQQSRRGEMLYRPLGLTGVEVSIVGLGGYHIGKDIDPGESVRIIRSAIDRGITFMDNSWDYNNGASEERMGKALRDGYRDKVFLMTKFDGRTSRAAAPQIDESLRRLQTDHVDLLMFHEVIRMEDADRFFGAGGAFEAAVAARNAGKTRFLGFTGHKDPSIHLHMLDLAKARGFKPDAVLMPMNVMDAHYRSFQHQVLPRLVSDGIGVLSMKPMGGGYILKTGAVTPEECLHYVMTVSPGTVITGIDSIAVLNQALTAVRNFKPMTQAQLTDLLARTSRLAADGAHERFKTSDEFDSTAHNPEWMG
jgi:aryl-alcohol dehydrogenase-like predicted oxidoreductase